ncbi:DUF2508 family protein [Paenibacillus solisilvae]|uniref:DUF2508 family protein n=1 Tax=Paenibacillus solisilvae TaxID=2486751 RepID=A0ABW0W5A8_9BACL
MRWKNFWQSKKKKKYDAGVHKEALELYAEIQLAKKEWDNAGRYFEYAVGKDQIDYAIFAIEAAEKRYEMLLRRAKLHRVETSEWSVLIKETIRGEVI